MGILIYEDWAKIYALPYWTILGSKSILGRKRSGRSRIFDLIHFWNIHELLYTVDHKKMECLNCFHVYWDRDEDMDVSKRFVYIILRK